MAKGGARPGSGRKPGVSKATLIKLTFKEFFTDDEIKEFVSDIKIAAKTDSNLKKFVAEQLFGKAPQRVEVSGQNGEPIKISWE
jgi:hypothetical protein